ncbi:MAG: group II intron reverse transcriptase/maturase [Rickettsiaceae bacterium]|nr:group II intron reverse transcriptase/maturase [Rickettsiaceae bacterium]
MKHVEHNRVAKSERNGESQEASLKAHASETTPRLIEELKNEGKLMERILERGNMQAALKRVRQNKGCAGEDGMEISELNPYLIENWPKIKASLLSGKYKPNKVKEVEIPKRNGGKRMLGIPTVLDRLIQQAIMQVLQGYIDATFDQRSYGFRPNRSAHQAAKKAKRYMEEGNEYAIEIDLEKYFDTVNHDRLMNKLNGMIKDQRVLDLIRRYLNSGIEMSVGEGVPQGSPLSPLLSNIYLDELDKELAKRGHNFVRYADDCNIYVKSHKAAERVKAGIKQYLECKMKLKVNEAKSRINKTNNILGFAISKEVIKVSEENIKKFKERIRELTKIRGGQSMTTTIKKLPTSAKKFTNSPSSPLEASKSGDLGL